MFVAEWLSCLARVDSFGTDYRLVTKDPAGTQDLDAEDSPRSVEVHSQRRAVQWDVGHAADGHFPTVDVIDEVDVGGVGFCIVGEAHGPNLCPKDVDSGAILEVSSPASAGAPCSAWALARPAYVRSSAKIALSDDGRGVLRHTEDMDRMGRSELHYRALEGDVEGIRTRLAAGDSVGTPDHAAFTPLPLAVQQSQSAAVEALLDAGAPIDAQDKFGNTPLFKAVFDSHGQGGTVATLLGAGADPDLPNHSGVTPRALARSIANYDITQFLPPAPRDV